jgi:Rrf2 family protein
VKLLTRNTDYAIRAICYISKRKDAVVSVTELVKAIKIPRPFLRKVLQVLASEEIVSSYKGIGGGFKLAKDPYEIRLTDIVEIFQGRVSINKCMFKKALCPNRKDCQLKRKIDRIGKHVISELRSITIGGLISQKG